MASRADDPSLGWRAISAQFAVLREERAAAEKAAAMREAERQAFRAWSAHISRTVITAAHEVLSRRVAQLQETTGLPLEVGMRVSESIQGVAYGTEYVHVQLPPCRVDLYATWMDDCPPHIHFALTTWLSHRHPRMVSFPGCELLGNADGGCLLRATDPARYGELTSVESLAYRALEMLVRACRAHQAAQAILASGVRIALSRAPYAGQA
ncbi:MAG: hypothetical protein JW940_13320 [Polyangiaceae bacterium]|nr:hypothetical protein [Polyangiaceae bacterium]